MCPEALHSALAEAVTGIYAGFASVGPSPTVYPMCMSVGWNPVFKNAEKTAEPWILHDFGKGASFYGEEIRLVACAYIRPEADFPSLDALVTRILMDGQVSREALAEGRLAGHSGDAFLVPDVYGA